MIKHYTFLFLFFHVTSYINANETLKPDNLDEGKKLLLIDEKFADALRFFTKELRIAAKNNQKEAVAANMYWISECLFQIRQLKFLKEVLGVSENFMKKENTINSYKNLMLIKAKYLIDIGKISNAIDLLLSLEKKDNDKDFINAEKAHSFGRIL